MDSAQASGPSNAEFFEFLARELASSLFRRSGPALVSFKSTIEFVFVPEGTADGPEEGLLFEGVAPMSHGEWRALAAAFAMTSVESRHDLGGAAIVTYRARENCGSAPGLPALARTPPREPETIARAREVLVSESARYVWTGAGRSPTDAGSLSLHVRRIACRGADSGMPARLLYCEKLRAYARRSGR
jgi:hypothetical protein